MQLTKNFTLEEFTQSDYADRHKINNYLPANLGSELLLTAQLLQKIRDYLSEQFEKDISIIVTSGYRCPEVNHGIGSTNKSDHILALAADFKINEISPYQICKLLMTKMDELGIGQLINELSWVHVSRKKPSKKINEMLTIDRLGARSGIYTIR